MNVNVNLKCKTLQRFLIKKELWSKNGYTRPRAYIIILRFYTLCFLYSNIQLLFEIHFKFTFTFTFSTESKTKVSIISPSSPLFLRRHVAIPASPRNNSYVATQEMTDLSKGISCLTSQLPGQGDSNAGTTIAFRPKMLYLCIVNETH